MKKLRLNNMMLETQGCTDALIDCREVSKEYRTENRSTSVLTEISLKIGSNEIVGITGASGAGKTTLLNLLGAIDDPTSGEIYHFGKVYGGLSAKDKSAIRRYGIGMIFQEFNIIGALTAYENIALVLEFSNTPIERRVKEISEILNRVGILTGWDRYPHQLSTGEKQRIAFARAFLARPRIIIADEPAGSVDPETGANLYRMLRDYARNCGGSVVIATHGILPSGLADRTYRIENGLMSTA